MKKKITSVILASSLLLPSSVIFAQDINSSSEIEQNEKIVSLEFINKFNEENNLPKLSEQDIPTVKELKEATKGLSATQENPVVSKDLGNGFGVTLWVDNTQPSAQTKSEDNQTVALADQNTTAKGGIEYTYLGVSWWRLTATANFNYNGQKITRVNSFDVLASGAPGYSVDKDPAKLADLDPSAKDVIGNAKFEYAKFVATAVAHLELRFTGTGNYYVHDSFFK